MRLADHRCAGVCRVDPRVHAAKQRKSFLRSATHHGRCVGCAGPSGVGVSARTWRMRRARSPRHLRTEGSRWSLACRGEGERPATKASHASRSVGDSASNVPASFSTASSERIAQPKKEEGGLGGVSRANRRPALSPGVHHGPNDAFHFTRPALASRRSLAASTAERTARFERLRDSVVLRNGRRSAVTL